MLYIAIGILGATVMPHNLYLHSSIVQTRRYELNAAGKREAIKFATIDSTLALMFALFINAAILIVVRRDLLHPRAATTWRRFRKPTNFSRRCSASPARARSSRSRYSLPVKTPRSPEHSPVRS